MSGRPQDEPASAFDGTDMAPAIELRNIVQTFPHPARAGEELQVVDDVSLTIDTNEFVTFIGPSGCGKSTLLRMIAGLGSPTSGSVLIDGKPLSGLNHECSMVFQHIGLVPWRSVERNVGLALELKHHRRLRSEDRDRIRELLELVGLAGFERYFPYQISGGMQQRVGIARALVTQPRFILMDEPFGALDAQTRNLLQDELLRLLAERGSTIVFVTHDLDEAVYLSDRIAVFSRRPAQVRDLLEVDLRSPRHEYDVRAEPEFHKLRRYVWETLRHEHDERPDLPGVEQ